MGEIAEDMIDGTSCSLCGQYFDSGRVNENGMSIAHTHGYPVLCDDCWEEGSDLPRSEKPTF